MDSTNRPKRLSVVRDGLPSEPAAVEAGAASQSLAGDVPARRASKIATVSHTLDATIAQRLRYFAFRERISESAVIEFALRELFDGAEDVALGARLREAGAALRRKS